MKKTGIWIDKEKAHIITLDGEKDYFRTVESDVEFYNVRGGSRSKTPWGPHQTVKDIKYTDREKHQLKAYFEDLAGQLANAEALYVFGPGDTKDKFRKALSENHPEIAKKIEAVETADSITERQMVQRVKEHFGWERAL